MKRSGNKNKGPMHNRFRHGMTATPTYKSWSCMKARCLNQNNRDFKNWGGRGISFCHKWENFEGFYEDMGEKPHGMTLERKDVNGHYSKENCVWADRTEQSRNRTYTKLDMTLAEEIRALRSKGFVYKEIAEIYGISQSQVFRVCKGQSWR